MKQTECMDLTQPLQWVHTGHLMCCTVAPLTSDSFHKFIILYADDGDWWLYKSGLDNHQLPGSMQFWSVREWIITPHLLSSLTPGIC